MGGGGSSIGASSPAQIATDGTDGTYGTDGLQPTAPVLFTKIGLFVTRIQLISFVF